ncbi:MAG: choice-of-anchor D domain-containing protein [Kiritimatiellia bacterium]
MHISHNLRRILQFSRILFLLSAPAAVGQTVTTIDSGSGGWVGERISGAVINGNPALCYVDRLTGHVRFARNASADGSGAWTTSNVAPIPVSDTDTPVLETSLAVVAGNPALVFCDADLGLYYARNANANGTGAWTTNRVSTTGRSDASLAVVAGNPAASFYDADARTLRFARNANATGTGAWTLTTVDAASRAGVHSSLAVVAGNPAIAYFNDTNDDLLFARCSTADGTGAWTITTVDATGRTGEFPSLAVVNGMPAIAYYDFDERALRYATNSAADGSGAWTTVIADPDQGLEPSLAVINGTPAISYFNFDANKSIRFARCATADGTGAWTLTSLESVDIGFETVLFPLASGRPAVGYHNTLVSDAKLAVNANTSGTGAWTLYVADAGTGGRVGVRLDAASVQGKPAVAYWDQSLNRVLFARNASADGSGAWTITPVADAAANISSRPCPLAVVNGFPMVALPGRDTPLLLARNTAADGSGSWVTNAVPVVGTPSGWFDLAEVAGRPAIVYRNQSSVRFARAGNADGTGTWTEAELQDASALLNPGTRLRLVVIAGVPVVAHYDEDNTDLRQHSNALPDGSGAWTTRVVYSANNAGLHSTLAEIAGLPFHVSFQDIDALPGLLVGHRGRAVTGPFDAAPVLSATLADFPSGLSLAEVGGLPAVTGYDPTAQDLVLWTNANPTGAVAWTSTVLDSAGDVGSETALLNVDGRYGAAYYDRTNSALKWALGPADAPSTPDLDLELNSGALIADGDALAYGVVGVGGFSPRVFVIRNNGTAALTGISASLTGTDAAHFTLFSTPAASVTAGNTSNFSVRFTPTTFGFKQARLTIVSNDPNEGSYDVLLSGFGAEPDIAVEQPAGTDLPDGGAKNYGSVNVGVTNTLTYTLLNTGLDVLRNLSAGMGGANPGDFIVTGSTANLAAGSNRTFTVAFAPQSHGARAALLTLLSDDPDESPYEINLSGTGIAPDLALELPAGTNWASGVTLDFGTHMLGAPAQARTFTLRNVGNATLTGISVSIIGANADQFSVSTTPGASLSVGGQAALTVQTLPTSTGAKTATLRITSANEPDENPFLVPLAVLAVMPGSLDTAVNPDVNGAVNAIAVQPDGKIVIAGDFTQVGGQARGRIARLLPDGSLESTATFNPGSGANAAINALAIQPDGKILVGGTFTNFNGVLRSRLLRLEANGAPEGAGTWTQPTVTGTAVNAVAVQADGRIVIGGDFSAINATAAGRIARLSSAGVPEGSGAFNPGTGAANTVRAVAVQADGKILIGGDFTTVNGTGRNRLARLNTNGTLEGTGTFTPGTAAPASVRALLVQEDGRIVVAGDFSTFNGAAAGGIVRLGSNGVPEGAGTFNPGTGAGTTTSVRSLALHASGHILAGGAFTTFNGAAHGRLVMLRADGTVESSSVFNAGTGANGIVASVAIGANGRLILGGSFTQVNGTARNRFAQLLHTPPVSTLAASSRQRLFWQLSGSAAAVSDVTFEQSVNGGVTWTRWARAPASPAAGSDRSTCRRPDWCGRAAAPPPARGTGSGPGGGVRHAEPGAQHCGQPHDGRRGSGSLLGVHRHGRRHHQPRGHLHRVQHRGGRALRGHHEPDRHPCGPLHAERHQPAVRDSRRFQRHLHRDLPGAPRLRTLGCHHQRRVRRPRHAAVLGQPAGPVLVHHGRPGRRRHDRLGRGLPWLARIQSRLHPDRAGQRLLRRGRVQRVVQPGRPAGDPGGRPGDRARPAHRIFPAHVGGPVGAVPHRSFLAFPDGRAADADQRAGQAGVQLHAARRRGGFPARSAVTPRAGENPPRPFCKRSRQPEGPMD